MPAHVEKEQCDVRSARTKTVVAGDYNVVESHVTTTDQSGQQTQLYVDYHRPRMRTDWMRLANHRGIGLAAAAALSMMLAAPALGRASGHHRRAHHHHGTRATRCTVSGARAGTHHVVAAAPGVEMTKIGERYYGCFAGTRKRVTLFTDSTGTLEDRTKHMLRFPHVAGPFAGFDGEAEDPYGAPVESAVTVVDLRTGHRHRTAVDCLRSPFACVSSLVLAVGGQVAWMTTPSINASPGGPVSVYAKDAAGRRMLDSGTDVDPASLMLNGLTVSWVRAGVMRSALLA